MVDGEMKKVEGRGRRREEAERGEDELRGKAVCSALRLQSFQSGRVSRRGKVAVVWRRERKTTLLLPASPHSRQ
jgi:hypothetical protein